jgi:hypothetical protein
MSVFKTIVWAFTKAVKACDKQVDRLTAKESKTANKIYKQEVKREAIRKEREQTYRLVTNLKQLIGVEEKV